MSLRPPPPLEKLHDGLMTTVDCHVRSSGLTSEEFVIQHMKNLLEVYPNVRQLVANDALLNDVPGGTADPNLIPVQVVQGAGSDNIDEQSEDLPARNNAPSPQPPILPDGNNPPSPPPPTLPAENDSPPPPLPALGTPNISAGAAQPSDFVATPLQNPLVEEEKRIADEPMESEETAARQDAELKRPEPTNIVPESPSSSLVNPVVAGPFPSATLSITTPPEVPLVTSPEEVALRSVHQQQLIRGGGRDRRYIIDAPPQDEILHVSPPQQVSQDPRKQSLRPTREGRNENKRGNARKGAASSESTRARKQTDENQVADGVRNSSNQPGTSSSSSSSAPFSLVVSCVSLKKRKSNLVVDPSDDSSSFSDSAPPGKKQKDDIAEGAEGEEENMENDENLHDVSTETVPMVTCCDKQNLTYTIQHLPCDQNEECQIKPFEFFVIFRVENVRKQYCLKCFEKRQAKKKLKKNEYERIHNDEVFEDVFICTQCNEAKHSVCENYLGTGENFICKSCARRLNIPDTLIRTVEHIKKNEMDTYMTEEINRTMREECKSGGFGEITCLNIHSQVTSAKLEEIVSKCQVDHFKNLNYNTEITYTERCFHIYQRQKDVDILIMVIYSQEYVNYQGTNSVMLDYLDTVPFLQPLHPKRKVYHTAINSYFCYLGRNGFRRGHFWAQVAKRGSYIFNVTPLFRHEITDEQLSRFYHQMLEDGKERGCYRDWRTFRDQKKLKKKFLVEDLPLFKGSVSAQMCDYAAWYADYDAEEFPEELENQYNEHLDDNYFIDLVSDSDPMKPVNMKLPLRVIDVLGKRENFVGMCQDNMWEFRDERMTTHSSIGIINIVHTHIQDMLANK